MAENELSNVRSFTILRSGEGLTSFNIDNSANFSNEKKYNGAFCGVHFLRIHDRVQRNSFLQLAIRAS